MAQVKKLQSGGTLTVNGKQYTADQINEYINSANLSSQERAALAGTVNAIANGRFRTLDRNANSLSGEGVQEDFSGFYGNDKRAEKNVGKNSRWANRQARRNSDHHIVNSAIEALGGIEDFYNKKKESDTTLAYGSGWFDRDEKGNYVSGPGNISREKHIRSVFDALASGQTPTLGSGWGDGYENLKNWYKAGYNPEELLTAIKNNDLSAEQLDILKTMGYIQSDASKTDAATSDLKQQFDNAGYDYDTWSPYVMFDKDGRLVARTGEDGKSVFAGLGGNGNYYFNQQFADANSKYAFLKDHFLIDGVLYKASDASDPNSELYKYLRRSGGFYDLNKSGDWIGANNLIRQYWDEKERSNYGLASEAEGYSPFLYQNPHLRWTSLTGAYDYPLTDGQSLIEIYDPNGEVDMFGWGKSKYAVLDKNGNLVKYVTSPGNLTGKEASPLSGNKIIRTHEGDIHNNRVVQDITIGGEATGMGFEWDPKDNTLIYKGDIKFASDTGGKNYVLPKEISDIFMQNPDFFKKLGETPGMLIQFQRLLGSTLNTGFRDAFRWATNDMSVGDWEKLGFSPDQAEALNQYFDDLGDNKIRGDRNVRRHQRLVDPVQSNKFGGKVAYLKKLQPGGTVGTSNMSTHTEKAYDGKFQNTENFAAIGDDKFTASDWTELGALVADLTGVGLGLSGAPIASGVAGAIGSTAGFVADINRDGLDWGDVGSYGLNLGLDLVSVLPFLGSAAQGAKVAKGIQKAGKVVGKLFNNPTVIKSLAGLGIGSAVKTSAEKIINGEKWDMRDVRNVLNGLTGVMTLRKTGLFEGGKTKQTSGEIDVKIKGKETKVKLSEADLAKIQGKTGDDANKALQEIIIKKNPKQKLKAEDIDFSSAKVEKKLGLRFWKGKQPTGEYDLGVTTTKEGPKLTGKGIADGSQRTQRFNEWLRTGQWFEPRMGTKRSYFKTKKEAIDAGGQNLREFIHPQKGTVMTVGADIPKIKGKRDFGNSLRTSAQKDWWNPFRDLTPETRAMLRKATFYTPNFLPNFERVVVNPEGFVARETPVYYDYNQYFYKKGGKVKKYQTPADVMVGVNGEIKKMSQSDYDKMSADYKSANLAAIKSKYGFTFDSLTPEEKEEFKRLRLEAEKNGTELIFKGQNFGKVTPSVEIPTNVSPQTNNLLVPKQNKPKEISVEIPEQFEVTEEPVNEPSILEEIYNAGPQAMHAHANAKSEKAMKDASDMGYSKFRQKRLGRRAFNSAYRDLARFSIGSQKGEGNSSSGIAGEMAIGIGSSAAKLGIGLTQSNRQKALARKNAEIAKSSLETNIPEFYGTFDDGGIKQVYENAALDAESAANNPVTSDALRNRQFRRQAAAEARKLRLEGGFKQSQAYSNWKLNQERLRDDYATKRTAVENRNRQRIAAADAMLNQQLGAGIAQDAGLWQGFIGDISKIAALPRAQKYQTKIQNLQNEYADWMTGLKSDYQTGIDNKSIDSGTTFDSWLKSNKSYLNQQRDYQRKMSNLGFKYKMNSLYKKGGKVRSAEEQIKIDNEKARHKAIAQLSKQAFELLKMALK